MRGVSGWDDLTKAAGGIAAFATAFGGLAVAGVLEQVERNHAGWLLAALVAIVAAGVIWAAASAIPMRSSFRVGLEVAVAFLFAAGLLLGVRAIVLARGDDQRPSISAALTSEGGWTLEATVKAGGLRTDEHLRVLVEGISWQHDSEGGPTPVELGFARLYESWLGPDENGKVEHKVRVPLASAIGREAQDEVGVRAWVVPPLPASCQSASRRRRLDVCADYAPPSCFDRPARRSTGCIRLRLPRGPSGPQLNANWAQSGDDRRIAIKVGAGLVRPDTGSVTVNVYSLSGSSRQLVSSARLRPDARGTIDNSWNVPIATPRPVCVVAAIALQGHPPVERLRCPPAPEAGTAWTRLPADP